MGSLAMRKIIALFVLFVSICACGSSGSDSSSDTGSLVLGVNPNQIKVGTISFVTLTFNSVGFDDLDKDGINIKFLLPEELEFVKGSAVLVLRDGAVQIEPVFNGAVGEVDDEDLEQLTAGGTTFVVFSIPGATLDEEVSGTIEFNVRGTEKELKARLSVDLDKGEVKNFDASNSGFDPEATTEVDVIEDKSSN